MILLLPPTSSQTVRPSVIWVGGVPGAGKSTALASLAAARPDVTVLDPDRWRRLLRRALPDVVGYRCYRPLVHLLHATTVLTALLLGPGRPAARGVLVVHETQTRSRRRRWLASLARRLGWHPSLLLLDVSRDRARTGQQARGRVVGAACFDRHWRGWQRLRAELGAGQPLDGPGTWDRSALVGRGEAVPTLARWCQEDREALARTRVLLRPAPGGAMAGPAEQQGAAGSSR